MNEQKLFQYLKKYWVDLEDSKEETSRYDCYSKSTKTRIELKCRRKHYDTLIIEKGKYNYLLGRHKNHGEIPLYINSTPKGIYCFDLRQEVGDWITDNGMPKQTDFKNNNRTKKTYCLLPLSQAITISDMEKKKKAIKKFVDVFGGSFKKLGANDVDYKVFDKDNSLVAYAEVRDRTCVLSQAYPLPIAIRKLVKLCDKRLNPVMIWACDDGIIYAKVKDIYGDIRWGGRKPRQGAVNDEELMAYYDKQRAFKYIRYS